MKLLLDTCVFLWLGAERDAISDSVKKCILESENSLYLSNASIWEICLKARKGKMSIPPPTSKWILLLMQTWEITPLDISFESIVLSSELPPVHSDPFDRLLVAQAVLNGAAIATPDEKIRSYEVPTLW